jgi:hypothetical protein
MDGGGVTRAFDQKVGLCRGDGVLETLIGEDRDDRTQLLLREQILRAGAFGREQDDARGFGDVDARERANLPRRLADDVLVQVAAGEHRLAQLLNQRLVFREPYLAGRLEGIQDVRIFLLWSEDELLVRADDPVVE